METKLLTVKFGGEWKLIEGDLSFVGDVTSKVIVIKETLSLEELKNDVIDRFDIDRVVFELKLSHLHPFQRTKEPFVIENDADLRTFSQISELKEVDWTLPLYISTIRRVNEENGKEMILCADEYFQGTYVIEDMVVSNFEDEAYISDDGNPCDVMDDKENSSGITKESVTDTEMQKSYALTIGQQRGNVLMCLGRLFKSKEELKIAVELLAVQEAFGYKVKKSTPKYFRTKCVDDKCQWMIHATRIDGSNIFEVKKYVEAHTCNMQVRLKHRHPASYKVVAEKIKPRYEDINEGPTPKQIGNMMRSDYKVKVSYWKSWKAQELAQSMVRGTEEDSYTLLPAYCWILKQNNPGTTTFIQVDDKARFKYLFISFGASIRAFPILRKVIVVDGAFLKAKYGGVLLVATAQDANQQIYPLAFAIVDSENDSSWRWFFEKLVLLIPSSEDLVFVSDRHRSIGKAIEAYYPSANHCACIWHLKQNIRSKYKKKTLCNLFDNAARSYTINEFNGYFGCIAKLNSEMEKYLVEANVEKWARVYCKGERYNIMTSNNAETLNSIFREGRSYTVIACLNEIRKKLSEWFNVRINECQENNMELPSNVSKIVLDRCKETGKYNVKHLNNFQFEILGGDDRVLVDLNAKSCTCKVFDLERIPCVHALAAIEEKGLSVVNFVSQYYRNESWYLAYHETIYPVLSEAEWIVPEEIKMQKCYPPSVRRKSGRPQKKRKPSVGEYKYHNRK